ncbi:MAG: hypothetical protein QM775_31025 [Pirellulales bacterium]
MSTVSIPDTPSQALARSIMGKNFLGIEEVRAGYGFSHTDEQRQLLSEIPFSDETLQRYKDTHVLVAGAALSFNEMRKIVKTNFLRLDFGFYLDKSYPRRKVRVRWHLLRDWALLGSCDKTYKEQTALLKGEEVPFACEMIYLVFLYYRTYRENLLPNIHVCCADRESGKRVIVGKFMGGDELVVREWNGSKYPVRDIGLASSVLPDKSRTLPA